MSKDKKYILAFIMLIPLLLCATLYVDDDWTENNCGGHTWGVNAFAVIQNAINYAEANIPNEETILVYEGTYQENIVINTDSLRIESRYYVTGDEDTIENTIIDGDDQGRCIWIQSDSVSVCGLKLINGLATSGGGILASPLTGYLHNLRINDCIIYDCASLDPGLGGGICINNFAQAGSTKEIYRTIISYCHCGSNGGGLALIDSDDFVITDCEFINNDAWAKGGGALISHSSNIDFIGCLFARNDLDYYVNEWGAAICYVSGGNNHLYGHVTNCTIVNNSASNIPGIKIEYLADYNHLQIRNSIILDLSGISDTQPDYCNMWTNYGGTNICETDLDEVFVDADNDDYHLPYYSPCINTGDDDSDYDDPDGSVADMGWSPYEHDVYKWTSDASSRVYLWKCFPSLPFPSNQPANEGDDIDVDEVWENWRPIPTSYFYAWYESTNPVVNGLYTTTWSWGPTTYTVNSTKGYKLQRTGTGNPVMFSRGLLCEADVELNTSPGEDWLGYFLPSAQRVLDAFPSAVTDDAIKIWTQNWCISRSTVNDPWKGTPTSCYLHYMDAVLITTIELSHPFEWKTPTREDEVGVRPVAEHFTFVDEIDYQSIYVYFEEDDMPQEVAVYVNDVCKGAQVVEDTICQICAYILEEDEGEEIEFAFWYDDRSEIERCNSYLVYNEESGEYRQQSLLTGTPEIHYEVSFKDHYEDIVPVDHDLLCYPNPFNPELTISFNLEETRLVNLDVYNIRGQRVKSLAAETFRPDDYNIVWKRDDNAGNKVSSGVYYIRLQVGEETVNRKVILMK